MNSNRNLLKGPLLWTLLAGVGIGAASVATFPRSASLASSAHAQPPEVTTERPRPITSLNVNSMEALKAINESMAELAKYAEPAVVHIKVEGQDVNVFGNKQMVGGEGSGFIFRPDGYIVTNDHVAGGFDKVTVILHDGREFPGKVIRAEESDIAVVKIDAKDLPTLPFADSAKTQPGEFAMAIGAPFGLDSSVTIGHVSATGRVNAIPDPRTGKNRQYGDLIQTDAQINMGNSGGPLINVNGEVIGINTAIYSTTGYSNGIGFAISSNQARYLAETLIEKGKVERGYLGVNPENLKEYQQKQLGITDGAILTNVESDSPAAMAGLKVGDVVVRVGSTPIRIQSDLRNSMFRYGPGARVPIEFIRDKEHRTVEVTLGKPKQQERNMPELGPDGKLNLPPDFKMPDIKGFGEQPSRPDKGDAPAMSRPKLGVQLQDVNENSRKQFSLPSGIQGVVVTGVEPGSLADSILNMQPGDVIQQFGSEKVTSAAQLAELVRSVKPGEKRSVTYKRINGNSESTVTMDVVFR